MNLIGKVVNTPSAAHFKNTLREYPHCLLLGEVDKTVDKYVKICLIIKVHKIKLKGE